MIVLGSGQKQAEQGEAPYLPCWENVDALAQAIWPKALLSGVEGGRAGKQIQFL
jgi:hypothetical protein